MEERFLEKYVCDFMNTNKKIQKPRKKMQIKIRSI